MKKIVLSIVLVLMVILCGVAIFSGFPLFGINSIGQIQEEDQELDKVIAEATKVASTDYDNALESIKQNMKNLEEEKKSYEEVLDTVSTTDENGKKTIVTAQKYEIEYLWAVIGNHAKSEGVEIKMDLKSRS